MNFWGWLCLIVAIASGLGILYIDWRYRQRDRAEMRDNTQQSADDVDWFV